jgi:predicted ATP-grasp superfamily ATP-dependent carboligase
MKLGMFDLVEPLPVLKNPHAVVVLRPWTDAGNSATLAMSWLESLLSAKQLGKISRPGMYFDFTRYRPMARYLAGNREIIIPNTILTFAKQDEGQDFIFINMLEPNMFAEQYIHSVLGLLKTLGIRRYCLLGSMYDMVPHTRPLIVTGGSTGEKAAEELKKAGVNSSSYEGPTTICSLITQEAGKMGLETITLMVRLPQYTQLEKDYTGQVRLLEVVQSLYGIPIDEEILRRARQQIKDIDIEVSCSRKLKEVVNHLETYYDAQSVTKQKEETPTLSPEVESFLKEMENRFKQD